MITQSVLLLLAYTLVWCVPGFIPSWVSFKKAYNKMENPLMTFGDLYGILWGTAGGWLTLGYTILVSHKAEGVFNKHIYKKSKI